MGSRETIVGTGADDASDVLDRRVEFEPRTCPATVASAGGRRPAEARREAALSGSAPLVASARRSSPA